MTQFVYKPLSDKDSYYWLRIDNDNNALKTGLNKKLCDGINHSFEFAHYWTGSSLGFMGKNLAFFGGIDYELSD